jgi:fructose-bisphosphate aldolase class I
VVVVERDADLLEVVLALRGPCSFAGLLHMTVHSLTKSAIFFAVGHATQKAGTQIIDEIQGLPSTLAIRENAWGLARYARICQQEGLVPIVEPEILMDGDHSIETTARIQEYVLRSVYDALYQNGVFLEDTLLQSSMTTPGIQRKESPEKIAAMTLETLQRSVPLGVPGIMFLSGGASEQDATLHLNALHQIKPPGTWKLSFSYGRGFQHSCLQTWAGRDENIEDAQQILFERAQANFEASRGLYKESNYPISKEPLFITHYQY